MIEYTTLGNLIAPAKVIRCGKGSFPVLSMTMHDGIVLQSERFKKSLASIDQSDYKVVKRGQLVVGFPIDEGVLYVQKAADEGIMSPAYNVWDIDTKKVDPNFLELCLHSPQSMQYYKDKLRGTTARRRSIPTADLLALKIRLPDMQTQREAVAIMRKAEAVIAARQEQLNSFEQLVKSRFIELFGDPVVNSMNWAEELIGDSCFVTKLAGFEYTQYIHYEDSGDVVMVKAQNVKNGKLNRKDLSYISNEVSDSLPRSQLAVGDVVMTYVGANIGDVAVIDGEYKYHLAPNVAKIRPNAEKYNSIYFMYMLMFLNSYIVGNSADTAKAALGMERIRKLKVFFPPIELQNQFAAFVEQTDKSKLAVQKGLRQLEILKKSLMQQYFG